MVIGTRFAPKIMIINIAFSFCSGVIAAPLEAVAKAHPDLSLGSYPFFSQDGYGSNLVVRGRDPAEVDAAVEALTAALSAVGVAAQPVEAG